jgi:hypothetical protein
MKKRQTILLLSLFLVVMLAVRGGPVLGAATDSTQTAKPKPFTQADREAAADRAAANRATQQNLDKLFGTTTAGGSVNSQAVITDYFGLVPNYANSPLPEIAPNTNLLARPGTLIKGSGPGVYVTDNIGGAYQRRAFDSAATFLDMGFHWEDIYTVNDSELLMYDLGLNVLAANTTRPNGMLVKVASSGAVYWLDAGAKRAMASGAICSLNGRSPVAIS